MFEIKMSSALSNSKLSKPQKSDLSPSLSSLFLCYQIKFFFQRKAVGFAVFKKNPASSEITSMLDKAARRAGKRPKYIITDKGSQFDCENYRNWCKRKKIKPRYGAVGKYGSIAIVERFIKSMKTEHLRRIMIPFDLDSMRYEVGLYMTWYNEHRPHETLGARTPREVYCNSLALSSWSNGPPRPVLAFQPKSQTPGFDMDCRYFEGRRHLPVISRVSSKAA